MRIPTGDFGYRVARPRQGAAMIPGVTAVGEAVQNLGQAGQQAATVLMRTEQLQQQELERQRKEQEKQAREMEKARAADALLDYEIYTKETSNSIALQVQDGTLPYEQARQQFDDLLTKAPSYKPSNGDPLLAESYARGTKRANFTAQMSVQNAAGKAMRADYKSRFASGLDKLGKLAGIPGADVAEINERAGALRIIGEQSGMPADQIDKSIQDFKDRNWFNQASQLQNEYSDNIDGLDRLKTQLTNADGFYADKLDPEKRTALIKSIDGRIDQLNNRADRAADKREAAAGRAIEQMDKQVASGIPGTAQQWLAWNEQVKGTAYEAEFKDRVNDEREVQTLLRQPLAEQSAYIQDKRQKMASNGGSLREQANLNRLEAAVESNNKLLRESPLIFNQNTTGQQVTPLTLSDLGSPQGRGALVENLRDRFNTVTALKRKYGPQVALNPWLPQESEAIKQVLASSNNEIRLGILSTIAQASPDGQAYASTLKAVAADQPVLMLAGMAQYRQLTTDEGRNVADTVLRGDRILNDKTVIMPTENAFRAYFEEAIGQGLPDGSPQREQAFLAYKAIYAQMANENGVRHTNEEKNYVDDRTARQAAKIATGGIFDYNGRKVIPPYGMPENRFFDNVKTQLEGIVKNTGYRMGDVEDMPLVSAGKDGMYFLMNGNKILLDKAGKQVVVNVK